MAERQNLPVNSWQGWAAQYPDGRLASVDYHSGGYPWKSDMFQRIHTFKDEAECRKYCDMFEELEPVYINITIRVQREGEQ